jgi:hypothetical protein
MSLPQASYSRKGWTSQESILTGLHFGMTNFDDHVKDSTIWSEMAEFLDKYAETPLINEGDGYTDHIKFVQGDSNLWERVDSFAPDQIDLTVEHLGDRYSRWVSMDPTADLGRIDGILSPIKDDQRSRSVESGLTVFTPDPEGGFGPNWTRKTILVAILAMQVQGVSARRIGATGTHATAGEVQRIFSFDCNEIMAMFSQTTPRYLLMAIYEFVRHLLEQEENGADIEGSIWTMGRILRHDEPDGGPDGWEGMGQTYLQPIGHSIYPLDMQGDEEWADRHRKVERIVRSEFILAYGATHDDMIGLREHFRFERSSTSYIGDLMFVNISNWTGVGLVLDGVRTATTIAPVLVPMGATGDNHAYLDLWSWISHHAPSDGKNQMFPDAEKVQNHPFGISKSGEIMFPSMTSASTFLHARMTLADLSGESGTADPEPEVKGAFIPAWKDKRGVKVIDHTGGRFPVFHDEVRCSVCNGRVLVKMPDGNKTGEWDCPQCDEKGAVKFKHLISPQHSGSDAPKESEK